MSDNRFRFQNRFLTLVSHVGNKTCSFCPLGGDEEEIEDDHEDDDSESTESGGQGSRSSSFSAQGSRSSSFSAQGSRSTSFSGQGERSKSFAEQGSRSLSFDQGSNEADGERVTITKAMLKKDIKTEEKKGQFFCNWYLFTIKLPNKCPWAFASFMATFQ